MYSESVTPANRFLLLDVDGVLMLPPEWFGVKIRIEVPDLAAAFFDGPFLAATRGEVDLLDHVEPILGALGRDCSPEEFLAEWHEFENSPNLPLCEAVLSVRHRFSGVFLATNQEMHRVRQLLTTSSIASLVDGAFASCTVGHRKPAPEYFAEVTRRLDIQPDRITFFDDAEENVIAAKAAGWTAHVFCDIEGFHAALAV